MSIELYLLVNLGADLVLIVAAARALGCLRWKRALLAGAICAACAVPAACSPAPWSILLPHLVLLAATSVILAGDMGARMVFRVAALLAGGALLSGGAAMLPVFGARGPFAAAFALSGAAALEWMVASRHPLRGDWQVRLTMRVDGRTARFPALIDTGNRLREPLSGLPVLIAEAELLAGALPRSGWRELRFGAVGGTGRMRCFRPSGLWIDRGGRQLRAPEVWIALSPGPLPGKARALAPPEFAGIL